MRPADVPGTRRWLLLPAAVLVLSGLMAAGCSSSKPAYCADADQLKTSVQNLGNIDIATNGLSSLQTALTSVKTSASAFVTDAKSAYPSQTAALSTSLSGLQTAITSAKGQPPVTAATTVVPAVTQVKSSAGALQSAASGTCQ
jgi:outer membrane murein-binding lipoprotein Lpp